MSYQVEQPTSDIAKIFTSKHSKRTKSLYDISHEILLTDDVYTPIRKWMNRPQTIKFLAFCEAIWNSNKFYWAMYDRAQAEVHENNDSQYPAGWHQKGGKCIAWSDSKNCVMATPLVAEQYRQYLLSQRDPNIEEDSLQKIRDKYLERLKKFAQSCGKDEKNVNIITNDEYNRLRHFEMYLN